MRKTPSNPVQPHKNGVVAVVQNSSGQYLFIKRGLKLKRAPGWWCFVGGEVEPDESFEAAIVREVHEEVGLNVSVVGKVHESITPNAEYLLHWMRVTLSSNDPHLLPHPVEVAEVHWLSLEEGKRLEPILPGLKLWLDKQDSV
jgi:8-oxo-dGTP pyrophosphatase MutT (NUDIX family)